MCNRASGKKKQKRHGLITCIDHNVIIIMILSLRPEDSPTQEEQDLMDRVLYGMLVSPGSLCFDIAFAANGRNPSVSQFLGRCDSDTDWGGEAVGSLRPSGICLLTLLAGCTIWPWKQWSWWHCPQHSPSSLDQK